jgi:hypothetical protein
MTTGRRARVYERRPQNTFTIMGVGGVVLEVLRGVTLVQRARLPHHHNRRVGQHRNHLCARPPPPFAVLSSAPCGSTGPTGTARPLATTTLPTELLSSSSAHRSQRSSATTDCMSVSAALVQSRHLLTAAYLNDEMWTRLAPCRLATDEPNFEWEDSACVDRFCWPIPRHRSQLAFARV